MVLIDLKSLAVAGIILAICLLDVLLNGGHALVFLLRKLFDLISYIEFWHGYAL